MGAPKSTLSLLISTPSALRIERMAFCFYNKIHSNTQIIDALILCLGKNFNDNIIRWKLVRAFESFNNINVIKTLMEIEQNDSQLVIRNEAKRSLKIINNRTNS